MHTQQQQHLVHSTTAQSHSLLPMASATGARSGDRCPAASEAPPFASLAKSPLMRVEEGSIQDWDVKAGRGVRKGRGVAVTGGVVLPEV